MERPFISKSKYLSGRQCHKLLWHYYNAKDEIPAADDSTQAIFEQGYLVGAYGKRLFPDAIEIDGVVRKFDEVIRKTREALTQRKPIFEAAFKFRDAFARADILNPVHTHEWDIIEVKSSSDAKAVNLDDLALQRYTYEGSGLKIRRTVLMHINTDYIRKGDINPRKLFKTKDLTREVKKRLPLVEENLTKMFQVIAEGSSPEIQIGPHCHDPYECPLVGKCWAFLPVDNPFTLYRLRSEKRFDLVRAGVLDIRNIPSEWPLNYNQAIQLKTVRTRRPFVDKSAISQFLSRLSYPLYFLDFETINPAIPLFDGTRPYQKIPFQFSLHVQESPKDNPVHYGFLSKGQNDPRPEILRQLKQLLEKKGSVIAYNAKFEKICLREMSSSFPGYVRWEKGIEKRMIDLLKPFESFSYYHPKQRGSASIKAILPQLSKSSYSELDIADGGTASREYFRVTFGNSAPEEKNKVYSQLEEYCKQDTQSMVDVLRGLQKLVK